MSKAKVEEVKTIITAEDVSGKAVHYVSVLKGVHDGKVLQVYYIRPGDGVIVGKDLESGKVLCVGKGTLSEEARGVLGLTMGRKKRDYSSVLDLMKEKSVDKPTIVVKATRNKKGQFVKV